MNFIYSVILQDLIASKLVLQVVVPFVLLMNNFVLLYRKDSKHHKRNFAQGDWKPYDIQIVHAFLFFYNDIIQIFFLVSITKKKKIIYIHNENLSFIT